MPSKKKYVISSASEISHDSSEKVYYLTETHPPGSLLRYARKDSKTNRASSFGGSVGNADDRGLYVILSASEISRRKSAELILRRPPPSREFALLTLTQRQIKKTAIKCNAPTAKYKNAVGALYL